MSPQILLIDACVAINICATDELCGIASTLSTTFLMVEQAANEACELREQVGDEVVVTAIDLRSYGQSSLQLTQLLEEEYPKFVELASLVDDGEAATIAIAQARDLPLATDDRKARRVCVKYGLPDPVRTLDLLHEYAEAANLDKEHVEDMLQRVRLRASYQPRQADPHFEWWHNNVEPN